MSTDKDLFIMLISFVLFIIVIVVGSVLSEVSKNECRIAGINAGKSAEDISKICK